MSEISLYAQAAFKSLQEAQQQLEQAEIRYSVAQEAAYHQGTHEADVELEAAYELYQEKCGEVAERDAGYKRLIEALKDFNE